MLDSNEYSYNVADYGSVLYATSSYIRSTIKITNEVVSYSLGKSTGAYSLTSDTSDLLSMFIDNTVFHNNKAMRGGSINTLRGAKVMCTNCHFLYE